MGLSADPKGTANQRDSIPLPCAAQIIWETQVWFGQENHYLFIEALSSFLFSLTKILGNFGASPLPDGMKTQPAVIAPAAQGGTSWRAAGSHMEIRDEWAICCPKPGFVARLNAAGTTTP